MGWLTQNAGTTTIPAPNYTRGVISDNMITITNAGVNSSSTNYYFINSTFCPESRQYWAYDISVVHAAQTTSLTTTARLNISGDVTGTSLNQVTIWVINPSGYSTTATPVPQSHNISLELLNPSELTANITTTGTNWDVGF